MQNSTESLSSVLPATYRADGQIAIVGRTNVYSTVANFGSLPATVLGQELSMFDSSTGLLSHYISNATGTAWISVSPPESQGPATITGPGSAGGVLSQLAVGDIALLSKQAALTDNYGYADASTEEKSRYIVAEYAGGTNWIPRPYGYHAFDGTRHPWGAFGNNVGLNTATSANKLYLQNDGTLGTTAGSISRAAVLVLDGDRIYVFDLYESETTTDSPDTYNVTGTVSLTLTGNTRQHQVNVTNTAHITAAGTPKIGMHWFHFTNTGSHNIYFTALNTAQPELAPQPWDGTSIVMSAWYDGTNWTLASVGQN